jgi:hypothetical protein
MLIALSIYKARFCCGDRNVAQQPCCDPPEKVLRAQQSEKNSRNGAELSSAIEDSDLYVIEERAAILEYDGGMTRPEAEALAGLAPQVAPPVTRSTCREVAIECRLVTACARCHGDPTIHNTLESAEHCLASGTLWLAETHLDNAERMIEKEALR